MNTLRASILHSSFAQSINEHDIALPHLRARVHERACDGGVEAAALPGAREQDSSHVMRPNTLATQPRQLI
jgi:hypothetical protein